MSVPLRGWDSHRRTLSVYRSICELSATPQRCLFGFGSEGLRASACLFDGVPCSLFPLPFLAHAPRYARTEHESKLYSLGA
jgi:hypothetical protein